MSLHKLRSLDLTAGGSSIALLVMIAAVILAGRWSGVRVDLTGLDEHGELSPYAPIVVTFSDPVDQAMAQSLLSIQPDPSGHIEWPDAKTLRFVTSKPLDPNINYRITLGAGSLGNNGLFLRNQHSWAIHVRKPQIVYMAFVNNAPQLWVVNTDGKSARQLGGFDKVIYDFDVAPDGEYLIFSALNDKQGADLWYLDRSGAFLRILLDCGADRCTSPSISPDNQQVAYTRETAPLTSSMPIGAPRIRLVNVQSGEDRSLYADPQIIGFEPGWSPDGKYITSYDGVQALIRVVAVQSGEQFSLPSATGDMPSWSPDSKTILFTDVAQDSSGAHTQVKMANVDTGEISIWIGKNDDRDYQYGELAWSLNGQDIILGMRVPPDFASRGLWLAQPDLLGGPMIAQDPNYIYQTPKWNAWGTQLVFEEEEIRGQHNSNITIWESSMAQPEVIAQGSAPHWLP
jgi:Tol biopolymer transport system component